MTQTSLSHWPVQTGLVQGSDRTFLCGTPTTLGAKLLISCTALRAYRSGADAVAKRCCEMWALVARCIDADSLDCIDFRALCNIIESFTSDNIRGHEEELLVLQSSQLNWTLALSRCISPVKRSWAAKNPKLTLNANSDVNAMPIFDRDEAPRRLC